MKDAQRRGGGEPGKVAQANGGISANEAAATIAAIRQGKLEAKGEAPSA